MRVAALVAVVAISGCGENTTPGPAPVSAPQPPAAAPPEVKSEAVTRADSLVADLKKREAAFQELEDSNKATGGDRETVPVVVEVSPPGKASRTTGDTGPTTPPILAPASRRSPVDVVSSSYTLSERNRNLWKFTWRMSIRNQERTPIRVRAQMDFRDRKGVLLDSADETMTIAGSTVADVAGFVLMKAEEAQLVTAATPKIALLR